MSEALQPTKRLIETADELSDWHQWSSEQGATMVMLDAIDKPRLVCEGEDGVLWITNPYAETPSDMWERAQTMLAIQGPFLVLWPAEGVSDAH